MKRNNKGFTLAEMLIVVAIIGVLVSVTALILSEKMEEAREATDLANIHHCIALVQEAAMNDTGANPSYWRNNGPYIDPTDNEKDLGTREVVRAKNSGVMVYKMWVRSQQKKPGWQGKISSVGGYNVEALTGSYNAFRVIIYANDPNTVHIEKAKINEDKKK